MWSSPTNATQARYVLGLPNTNMSEEEVTKAYKKLALTHHPDKHGNSDEAKQKFQAIVS